MIKTVTIIGLGTQGAMIAFRAAANGKKVLGFDLSQDQRLLANKKFHTWLDEYKEKYGIDEKKRVLIQDNLLIVDTLEDALENTNLIIENVPEVLALKQSVWKELDSKAPADALLTTNSSSLKSSDINQGVSRKDKTFNINFSFPVEDDMVEIMWNDKTSEETKIQAEAFLSDLGHLPLVTKKEIKGFSMNRMWRMMKKECLKLWAEGYTDPKTFDQVFKLEWQTPHGPYEIMDMVGLDVVWDIEMGYYEDSGNEDDRPPQALKDMVDQGMLGVKTGKGFYDYN